MNTEERTIDEELEKVRRKLKSLDDKSKYKDMKDEERKFLKQVMERELSRLETEREEILLGKFGMGVKDDDRVIWAIERFFIFSLLLTALKILVSVITSTFSIIAIAVDAVMDLSVAALGIYLIHFRRKKAGFDDGPDRLTPAINVKVTLTIAGFQGILLIVGAVIIVIQSLVQLSIGLNNLTAGASIAQFPVISALILSGIIASKYIMYEIHKRDRMATNNIALKSMETNLIGDIVFSICAWVLLILMANWYFPFIFVDFMVAILIAVWLIFSAVKYFQGIDKIANVHEKIARLGREEYIED